MSPNPQVARRSLHGWLVITLALLLASAGGSALAQERFNVLEALSIDASGTVELFGRNDPEGPKEPILYRQVLREALANSGAPQFSLDSDFSGFTRQMLAGKRMEDLFYSGPGKLSPFGVAALQALKVPVPQGDNADFTAELLHQAGFSLAAELHRTLPPGENVPSSATRAGWVRLLGLSGDLRRFLDQVKANPGNSEGASDRFYGELLQGLAHSMAPRSPRLVAIYRKARAAGSKPDGALGAALTGFLQAYNALTVTSVSILLERHEQAAVVLDADALQQALGVTPISRPRFVNLEPGSQLARILFEGDVALKSLPLDQSLTAVEGFRTFPEWARHTIGPDGLGQVQTNRLWISLEGAQVEIRESSDGKIASFGKVQMKVESRTKDAGESWNAERQDERTQAYADLLTRHFDALAERVPALHQLREAAKMVALAKWIHRKGLEPTLDHETVAWQAPEQVNGFLAMIPSHQDGRLYWGVLPSGGVDFDFDIVVTTDPSLTLESLRRRAAARRPLSVLQRDALQQHIQRYQNELERTVALERALVQAGGTQTDSLRSYLNETVRRSQEALGQSTAGLAASVEALRRLEREVGELPAEVRNPFLAAMAAAGAQPSMEQFATLDELQATAAPPPDLLATVEAWVVAAVTLSGDGAAELAAVSPRVPSLETFVMEALGTLVAFALYREHSLAVELLSPAEEGSTGPLEGLRRLREHQAAGLDQLNRRADSLDS